MDPKSQTLLQAYSKDVEKIARGVYLQTISIRKEIDLSKINPEDKAIILLNCINLLTKPADVQSPSKTNSKD